MIIIIIDLIYVAQFDTSSILTALYSHKVHANALYTHIDIHETIIFIHIYVSTHIYVHHVQIYMGILTRLGTDRESVMLNCVCSLFCLVLGRCMV